jgi:hypothetical protein
MTLKLSDAQWRSLNVGVTSKAQGQALLQSLGLELADYANAGAVGRAINRERSREQPPATPGTDAARKTGKIERIGRVAKVSKVSETLAVEPDLPMVEPADLDDIDWSNRLVSVLMTLTYKKPDGTTGYKRQLLTESLKGGMNRQKLDETIRERAALWIDTHAHSSEVQLESYELKSYQQEGSAGLGSQKARQIGLGDKLLLGEQFINLNVGQCMLDYVTYEMQAVYKTFSRTELLNYWGDGCISDGVSSDMLIDWAISRGRISVYALDPLYKVYDYHAACKCDVLLVVCMNNSHCYPLLDPHQKRAVAKSGCLPLGHVKYNITDWSNHTYMHDWMDVKFSGAGSTESQSQIVLLDDDDLCGLSKRCIAHHKYLINYIDFRNAQCTMFVDPVSGTTYVAAPFYKLRKRLLDEWFKATSYVGFRFANQSWATMGMEYFTYHWGKLLPSQYSPDYLHSLEEYPTRKYICDLRDCPSSSTVPHDALSIDTHKYYSHLLLTMEYDYPVYGVFDSWQVYNPSTKIVPGKYYIDCDIQMGGGTIWLSRGMYNHCMTQYCLNNNYIRYSNIKYVLRASTSYPKTLFRDMVATLYKQYDASTAKTLTNHLTGHLGRRHVTVVAGCQTDSFDTAIATRLSYPDDAIQIHDVGNLYFLRHTTQSVRHSGHVPLWENIIACGVIGLDRLYKRVVGPSTVVLGYNTDSIKCISPLPFERGHDVGDLHVEAYCRLDGNNVRKQLPAYKLRDWVQWDVATLDSWQGECSFMLNGIAGSGKSWRQRIITRMLVSKHKKVQVLGLSAVSVNLLKVDIMKNGKCINAGVTCAANTFESVFGSRAHRDNDGIKGMTSMDYIIVEEYSMVSQSFYQMLYKLKLAKPTIKFILCGDWRQNTPPESDYVPFKDSCLIKLLCDNNWCELPYVIETARYTPALYNTLQQYCDSGTLQLDSKLFDQPDFTICYRRDTRTRINLVAAARFLQGRQTVKIGERMMCGGMPLIAFQNHECGLLNSMHYTFESIKGDDVILTSSGGTLTIPATVFGDKTDDGMPLLDYGFADTVYRSQGRTIYGRYNVVEIEMFDRHQLYSAVSRATCGTNVGLDSTRLRAHYSWRCHKHLQLTCEPDRFALRIYKISDSVESYVGQTGKQLAKRLLEHKSKPVSKAMGKWLKTSKVTIELLIKVYCVDSHQGDELERQYIHLLKPTMNVLHNSSTLVYVAVQPEINYTKYEPVEDTVKRCFRIQYRDAGVKKSKWFRYASGDREQARMNALACRDQLRKLHYI